jgi:hypothetical protein
MFAQAAGGALVPAHLAPDISGLKAFAVRAPEGTLRVRNDAAFWHSLEAIGGKPTGYHSATLPTRDVWRQVGPPCAQHGTARPAAL